MSACRTYSLSLSLSPYIYSPQRLSYSKSRARARPVSLTAALAVHGLLMPAGAGLSFNFNIALEPSFNYSPCLPSRGRTAAAARIRPGCLFARDGGDSFIIMGISIICECLLRVNSGAKLFPSFGRVADVFSLDTRLRCRVNIVDARV